MKNGSGEQLSGDTNRCAHNEAHASANQTAGVSTTSGVAKTLGVFQH